MQDLLTTVLCRPTRKQNNKTSKTSKHTLAEGSHSSRQIRHATPLGANSKYKDTGRRPTPTSNERPSVPLLQF